MELYQDKSLQYFSNTRHDLISLLPGNISRLLEVGAGSGDTLVEIKKKGLANHVTGFELMRLPGTNQGNPAIDEFFHGDLGEIDSQLPTASFDAIICGDVLEHLVDPWQVLQKLTKLLRPGAILILSCPNIRYFGVFYQVFIRGTFAYAEWGVLDKTHLRFFCKKDLVSMVRGAGLKPSEVIPMFKFFRGSKTHLLNLVTLGIFEQFLTKQYVIKAQLTGASK